MNMHEMVCRMQSHLIPSESIMNLYLAAGASDSVCEKPVIHWGF